MLNYLKLYRLDVAFLSFYGYLFGIFLANNLDLLNTINFNNLLIGLCISLISTNFVYSFNSWSDWEIDKINKPGRPIPSGKLSPKEAFFYSIILLILSFIYPLLIFKSFFTLSLFLFIPLLGILYSSKPFYLKRYFILAPFIISIGIMMPFLLGYFMNSSNLSLLSLFFIYFLFIFSLILLKDIEDVKGDIQYNCINNLAILGDNILLLISFFGFILCLFMAILFNFNILLKVGLYITIITPLITILIFLLFKININKLFNIIICNLCIITAIDLFIWLCILIYNLHIL